MKVVELLKALLTPTIAIVTAYIAWRQYSDGKVKLNLERYEKRLVIYKAVQAFIATAANSKVTTSDFIRLRVETSTAGFLFGRDVPNYIDELAVHAGKLGAANDEYRDFNAPQPAPADYDHQKVCDVMHAERSWFHDQYHRAERLFGKYLNVA